MYVKAILTKQNVTYFVLPSTESLIVFRVFGLLRVVGVLLVISDFCLPPPLCAESAAFMSTKTEAVFCACDVI